MKTITNTLLCLGLLTGLAFAASGQSIVFTSLDGDRIDVEAQKNKVVVMAIGATWLPLSNDQASTVNKLSRKYAGRDDVIFYFIATDSASARSKNYATDGDIRSFSKRNKLNITILRDADGEKSVKKFNLDQLPAFIILDKKGKPEGEPIAGVDPFGEIDPSEIIARRIDRLL